MTARIRDRLFHLSRLGRHNAQIEIARKLLGRCSRLQRHGKTVLTGNAKLLLIQCPRMIFPPYQRPYLCNPRQMCRVEAPNGAATDNAHSLHSKRDASYTRRSTFTSLSAWQISFPTSARNKLSALLNESSITMPLSNTASCNAAEMV